MKAARIAIVFAAAALVAGCTVYSTPAPQQPQAVVQPGPMPPPPATVYSTPAPQQPQAVIQPGPMPPPPVVIGAPVATGAVSIHNVSHWNIHYIYMSSSSDSTWGPDRLGRNILYSGQTFTLTGIACDSYDIKLVDQDGDECEVRGIRLCGEHAEWTLTNDELLSCEFGQ